MKEPKFDIDLRMSDPKQWEEFKENGHWLDLHDWLKDRLEILYKGLSVEQDEKEMRMMQGAIKMCLDLANLPDILISDLEAQKQNREVDNG